MSKELYNPFQSFLAQAAKTLPAKTGETANYRSRYDSASAGSGVVILADVSGSMEDRAGAITKIEVLREALVNVQPDLPDARLVAFGSTAGEIPGASSLPAPAGGTALHLAIDLAAIMHPARTLVISDGQPDSEDLALAAAARLPGLIDVIYCGPDSDKDAIAFMYRLARLGGGRVVVRDVSRDARPRLGPAVRNVLGLPSPKGV
jgi:hypothetical protein